jgi:gamma-glutamylcyclotransferase (GGCT)/AIG2-like uncharacterized protein YtfP
MLVAVYGTLRQGQGRYGALKDSNFFGKGRIVNSRPVLLQTPAGFPAVVGVSGGYHDYLNRAGVEWWREYAKKNKIVHDLPAPWAGALQPPLVEIYEVTDDVLETLDIIEGVPHLYQRTVVHVHMVKKDTRRACDVYTMQPDNEWLQGTRIIWNGDFLNPIYHDTLLFNYNEWAEERENRGPDDIIREIADMGRVRFRFGEDNGHERMFVDELPELEEEEHDVEFFEDEDEQP